MAISWFETRASWFRWFFSGPEGRKAEQAERQRLVFGRHGFAVHLSHNEVDEGNLGR